VSSSAARPDPTPPPAAGRGAEWRRRGAWLALLVLLAVALGLLVRLTVWQEATRAQERVDELAQDGAAAVRGLLLRVQQDLQALPATPPRWPADAMELLRREPEVLRIERRDAAVRLAEALERPAAAPLFAQIPRADLEQEAVAACAQARRGEGPALSRSYFVPLPGGSGLEVIDLCLPLAAAGEPVGYQVATVSLAALLERALSPEQLRRHELSFVDGDGSRLARAGSARGAGEVLAERRIEAPGTPLLLRVDRAFEPPRLLPPLATLLVLSLSVVLFTLVLRLARDVQRRARAERALAEALAFRKAMEDSLSTGLRALDLDGRTTYVNPAFCTMVGWAAEALRAAPAPPYWPPELAPTYRQRALARRGLAPAVAVAAEQGFETLFMRRSGERFPVMIYEAPLVDGEGRHTGWMSAVLDVSAQRRAEELSRQQQERLQASARLATVGEMASLLGHELNQPLAAIASYATGSLNMLDQPDAQTPSLVRQGLQRIAEQADRAGRVIKSVHDFVRRREHAREPVDARLLVEAVLPLVRLQARKSGTRIELELPDGAQRVSCDRTLVEQVLLNLARNGIQAMEDDTPPAARVLRIRVRQGAPGWVAFDIGDGGRGIPPEVGRRLFTPFFTTRAEGMGLGLSLCRTVVEQHGGTLDFASPPPGQASGTEFTFTLPTAPRPAARTRPDPAAAANPPRP
jgi:two-component system sensor histidine kinase DctS